MGTANGNWQSGDRHDRGRVVRGHHDEQYAVTGTHQMSEAAAPVVRLDHVAKTYRAGAIEVAAIRDISLDIPAHRFTMIVGPSGSGKTTLLNLIGCIDAPTAGRIEVCGEAVGRAVGQRAGRFPCPQHRLHLPGVQPGPGAVGVRERRIPAAAGRHEAGRAAPPHAGDARSGRAGGKGDQRPNELSGGQKQRVAIARALVKQPTLVLADEPTANLDSANGEAIIALMRKMQAEQRTTFIFSTHDPQLMSHSEETFAIRDGQLLDHQVPPVMAGEGLRATACDVPAAKAWMAGLRPPWRRELGRRTRSRSAQQRRCGVMLFKIAFRNILRNRRRSLMTGSAIAVGAMAMLVFGCYISYIFAAFETGLVQRIGHLTVFRSGYFVFGAGNPAAYGIDDYQGVMTLIGDDPVLKPMIRVLTPTQSLLGIAGNFSAGNDAAKTFLGVGLIPSDRQRMRQWNEYGAGQPYVPDTRLADDAPQRGLIGGGMARILGLCPALKLADCPVPPVQHERGAERPAGDDLNALAQAELGTNRERHSRCTGRARTRRTVCPGSTCWGRPRGARRTSSAWRSPASIRRASRSWTTTTWRCRCPWRSSSSMAAASTRRPASSCNSTAART